MKVDRYSTCCYLKKDEQYLLLFRNKKKNDYNKGKWIGVGGGLEGKETPDECAIREVKEETGLDVHSLECAGEVDFIYDGYFEKMYIYEITDFSGDIIDCNEGELRWIPIKDIFVTVNDIAREISNLIDIHLFKVTIIDEVHFSRAF